MPAVVLVTMTLPAAVGRVSTNDAASQPIAGSTPPSGVPIPAAPATLVARMSAQNASDITGTAPRLWPNWKLPTSPSMTPSRKSAV